MSEPEGSCNDSGATTVGPPKIREAFGGSVIRDGDLRLEGLCHPATGNPGLCIRVGRGSAWLERLEARLVGESFYPHRHDTYAIGITLRGVQTFHYRGKGRHGLPGQCHVLHPDELHDGAAGTHEGFAYRIAYIDPSLVQRASGGRPLPFVQDPIIDGRLLPEGLLSALCDLDAPIDDIEGVEILAGVADVLERLGACRPRRSRSLRLASLRRVRELIAAEPATQRRLDDLEALSGLDRWTLARQFRAAFGTSPSRFRTMRQLDCVRRSLIRGTPLAQASLGAGFSDQSHMTRMFKRTYGLTPARWTAAMRQGRLIPAPAVLRSCADAVRLR